MDKIFILHADHEQNASTSTVRLASSSGANPFACIAAGITSLWGPAHGGANEAVLKMLMEIGSKDKIPEIIKRAKDKSDSFRLMGFGHRVYKNYDPRAKVMQQTCHEVLAELGIKNDPLLDTAMELERIALQDDYFIAEETLPECRFLFRHHPARDGLPDEHVHGAVCAGAHRRLGRALAGTAARTDPRSAGPASFTRAPPNALSCRSKNADFKGLNASRGAPETACRSPHA